MSGISGADQILVIEGSGFDPKKRSVARRLADVRSPRQVALAVELVEHVEPGDGYDWMEWPVVSLVVLRNRELVAEFGVLADCTWVRRAGHGDHKLTRPKELRSWLDAHGVDLDR